jgi:dihydroxy-acid dehydratase
MKKWRSRVTTDGLDRAPHRAFMRAMGLDDEAVAKPMVGVVSMKGEQTPCNMTHDFQVEAAKAGIAEAGGTPREFSTISVSDGISMNHEGMKFSLLSRELIADSIEAVVHGLAYDALIGFGGCDKTLPGVMMGMIRCNVPSIFIYGGSALPGRFEGKTLTGSFMTGEIDEATLEGIERTCLPTIGACAGQFTANTMGMVSEAMGLTMPNVSMIPGVYAERAQVARRAGRLVMQMLERGGPLPREIVTRQALENGAAIVAATGGSTNAALHPSPSTTSARFLRARR